MNVRFSNILTLYICILFLLRSLLVSLSPFRLFKHRRLSSILLSFSFSSSLCHPPLNATEQGQTKRARAQKKCKAASIMRATLSRRDQQHLNCIRDSRRTAHKFSSRRRRAILLLNTFSRVPVIRRILNATSPPFFFISRLSKDLQPSECSSFRLEPPV